jgi:hypothetical protein
MSLAQGRRAVTEVVVPLVLGAVFLLGIEVLRWNLRPEQRRLRMLKKIGGRRS